MVGRTFCVQLMLLFASVHTVEVHLDEVDKADYDEEEDGDEGVKLSRK